MNIVLLMAGSNELFESDGYRYPMPLIEVDGVSIIERVCDQLRPIIKESDNIIILVRAEDNAKYYLSDTINLLLPAATVVPVPSGVAGPAITALLAIEHLVEDDPLLILNGDQVMDYRLISLLFSDNEADNIDGSILVFDSIHPRWPYVLCDDKSIVIEAAEKKPISRMAVAGAYYYKKAVYYTEAAKKMIFKDSHTEGKYYIVYTLNEMILDNKIIQAIKIDGDEYHSFRTPDMIANYERSITKL